MCRSAWGNVRIYKATPVINEPEANQDNQGDSDSQSLRPIKDRASAEGNQQSAENREASDYVMRFRETIGRWGRNFVRAVDLHSALISAAATIVIAILTAFYVHYSKAQWAVMREQANISDRANQLSAIGLAAQIGITNITSPDDNGTVTLEFTNTGHTTAKDVTITLRHQHMDKPPSDFDPFADEERRAKEIAERNRIILREIADSKKDEAAMIKDLNSRTDLSADNRQKALAYYRHHYEIMQRGLQDAVTPPTVTIPEIEPNVTVTFATTFGEFDPPTVTVFLWGFYTFKDNVPGILHGRVPICFRYTAHSVESCLKFRPIAKFRENNDFEEPPSSLSDSH